MKKMILGFEKVISLINRLFIGVASILIIGMMILTFVDVAGRKFFRPVNGAHELTYLGMALIVFLSFGYVQSQKGHIAIGVWVDKWSKRAQAVADAITYLATGTILLLLAWQLFVFAGRQASVTAALGLPENIFIFICGIATVLFTLTILLDLLKVFVQTGDEPDEA